MASEVRVSPGQDHAGGECLRRERLRRGGITREEWCFWSDVARSRTVDGAGREGGGESFCQERRQLLHAVQ
jgi:hypothetical protein